MVALTGTPALGRAHFHTAGSEAMGCGPTDLFQIEQLPSVHLFWTKVPTLFFAKSLPQKYLHMVLSSWFQKDLANCDTWHQARVSIEGAQAHILRHGRKHPPHPPVRSTAESKASLRPWVRPTAGVLCDFGVIFSLLLLLKGFFF